MPLDLSQLGPQLESLADHLARQRAKHLRLQRRARASMQRHAVVTDELREKITTARWHDNTWRGAMPQGNRLDERHFPGPCTQPTTLIASDGSQVYPDNHHEIATYYLVNIATIRLRPDGCDPPEVETWPTLYYDEDDLYDEAGRLVDPEFVNALRAQQEAEHLADVVEQERACSGADRAILAVADGPLLQSRPERMAGARLRAKAVQPIFAQLDRMRAASAIPVGYVDASAESGVLRIIELADLTLDAIARYRTLRLGPFRGLTDRLLFGDLCPGQRTGLWSTMSQLNDDYAAARHRILFLHERCPRP